MDKKDSIAFGKAFGYYLGIGVCGIILLPMLLAWRRESEHVILQSSAMVALIWGLGLGMIIFHPIPPGRRFRVVLLEALLMVLTVGVAYGFLAIWGIAWPSVFAYWQHNLHGLSALVVVCEAAWGILTPRFACASRARFEDKPKQEDADRTADTKETI